MRNYNEWQIINEALQGNMPLGLSRPHTVGGVIGNHFSEGGFGGNKDTDDDDFDDDDDDDFDDEDDEGLDGDLNGSSSEDEGPTKNWPPEDGSGDFGDDEGDDDFLASLGAGGDGSDIGNGLEDLDGMSGGLEGDSDQQGAEDPDMSFLDDLPSNLLGDEDAEMGLDAGDDMGGEAPCPDCNPDGQHEIGEDGCPTCNGEGFVADDMGDEMGGLEDLGGDDDSELDVDIDQSSMKPNNQMAAFMSNMNRYMQKYMKKEANLQEFAPAAPLPSGYSAITPQQMQVASRQQGMVPQQPPVQGQPPMGQQPPQQHMRKMVKFMSKSGERSFMAKDAPRSYMKKDNCHEGDDFFNSLIKNSARQVKGCSGISEDALFKFADPSAEYAQNDPKPGDVGYAPQGRVGASIGNGYTMDDFNDIPTLGESTKYPSLNQFAIKKARAAAKKRR